LLDSLLQEVPLKQLKQLQNKCQSIKDGLELEQETKPT